MEVSQNMGTRNHGFPIDHQYVWMILVIMGINTM